MALPVINIEWLDAVEKFEDSCNTQTWPTQPNVLRAVAGRLAPRPDVAPSFTGASLNEIRGYLRDGYTVIEPDADSPTIEPRKRRRAKWSEDDGEPDAGRLYCGSDDFYLTRGVQDSKPGLSIDVLMNFASLVSAETITNYGRWVAQFLSALESQGCDLEVAIVCRVSKMYEGKRDRTKDVRIIVKRPNEVSDFSSWSALFAPGGFRALIFTAIGLAGDRESKVVNSGLGRPEGGKGWKVTRDEHKISVDCHAMGRGDLETQLTESARAAGLI